MKLKGRRALVTGGASGIGLAITEQFVAEGACVVIADLSEPQSAAVAAKSGGKIGKTVGDVSRLEDAERMVREAVAFLGGLDLLVNNAGIETIGSVTTAKDDEWERQIAINLNGVYRVSRFAVPEIIRAGGGAVINLGSIGGLAAVKEYSAYGAAKAGVVQLTRSMAADFAEHGIRVNCICPGPIQTPMLERACRRLGGDNAEAIKKLYADATIMKRVGRPEEIASVAVFLASDDSSYVTGVTLPVDGGFTAQ